MSASGGKADITIVLQMSAYDPKRKLQSLRKELKGTLVDEGPHEDQEHNCRRA